MNNSNSRRTWLWFALGAVIALSLLWEVVPRADATARLNRLPKSGFNMASRDVPLNPVEADIYRSANICKRIYQVGRQQFILLAIDGTHDRHAVHDPMYCFSGAGWKTGSTRMMRVPGGLAKLMDLTKDGQTVEVLYWISDGHRRHASAFQAWCQSTLRRVTFGASGEEPVLFILQPMPGQTVDYDNIILEFPELFDV